LAKFSQTTNPEQTALRLIALSGEDRSDVSAFKRYASGRMHAGLGRTPEARGDWVKLAAKVWPGSDAWFATPFWYLLQHKSAGLDEVYRCIKLLPRDQQEDLLTSAPDSAPLGVRMGLLTPAIIYTLTDPLSPWTLGALMCQVHRARFADDPALARRASVGITWALHEFLSVSEGAICTHLNELMAVVARMWIQTTWCGEASICHPPTDRELAQFERARRGFIEYFEDGDLTAWDILGNPPWVGAGSDPPV